MVSDVFPAAKLDILFHAESSLELQVVDDVWRIVECDVSRYIVTIAERGPKR